MTECQYKGKMEFARDARKSELKELHLCKNKKIEFVYCETATHHGLCDGEMHP
jgi:hypothetical protein